jgi:class 3 adenylate cyclase/predicted negative regulator of RcsB-dependent stress response
MEIDAWLESLGLEPYAAAFRANAIDADTLGALTDDDLRELGVAAIGHRKKLLTAIAALSAPEPAAPPIAAPTPAPSAASGGERRPLTVMFTDLVGSTEMAGRLDPEEWHDILVEYHRTVAAAVARFGGYVAKNLGDGALIYFGFPQAEENDAERAARAGLAILDAIAVQNGDLAARGGPKLAARIGIHAGPVVLGADTEIYGDVPNIAARVQAEAEPGTVLVTGAVHHLISGLFIVAELGLRPLKGVAEPVALLQVQRAVGRGRWRAAGRVMTPLVGRESELARLDACWRLAQEGKGQLVLLTAEAGLGKSRLADEFRLRLADVPHLWTAFSCSQLAQNTPFRPFIDLVKPLLDEQAATPAARIAVLSNWHREVGLDPAQSLPLVAPLFELELPPGFGPAPAPSDDQRHSLIQTLARWIMGGAKMLGGGWTQAIVLVIEDAHWADPSTLDLLRVVAEEGARVPLLLLVTARPEFTPPWPERPHHSRITLAPLERGEVQQMVMAVAAHHAGLVGEAMEALVQRTGGVPLFVEEVTRLVLEGGGARQHIPLTLQGSLAARLDRLGPIKELAQIAAVLGREFNYRLLREVTGLDDGPLAGGLAQLIRSGIIQGEGRPPESLYRFKHALMQDAAYGTLLRQQRQLLHARIAETLERQFPSIGQSQPALLARHCAEAGLTAKAVANWLKAGQMALARSAMAEAAAQLQQGLHLLLALPEDGERQQLELELQLALATALRFTKGFAAPEVERTLDRAEQLTERLDPPEYRAQIALGQWLFYTVRSEHGWAQAPARDIEQIGRSGGNRAIELTGRRLLGQSQLYCGDFVACRALLEDCLEDAEAAGILFSADQFSSTLAALAPVNLAAALAHLGHLDQAKAQLAQGLAAAQRLGQSFILAEVLSFAGWIDALTGAPELEAHADALMALATEQGFTVFVSAATAFRGWAACLRGEAATGLALIEEGVATGHQTGAVFGTAMTLIWLARTHAALGRPEEGLAGLAQARELIELTGERVYEAELNRAHGDLLAATGAVDAAERRYREALAVAQGQHAKLLELQAATGLARLLLPQRRRAEAGAVLLPILDWFTEGRDTPDLRAAREVAAELSRQPA